MHRMLKMLLLVTGCVALTGIAYWQGSSSVAAIPMPAAKQLKPAAAPPTRNNVAAATPSKGEAAVALEKTTARAATRKSAARVERRDPPAAVTVDRREIALPLSSRDVKVPPAELMTYERRVADATTVAGQDSDRALLELQRLAADEPRRPEAYQAMAAISLRKRDYGQARELLGSALAHGGKATFTVIHDHSRGNFDASDAKATCVGELTILADEVTFDPRDEADRFSVNTADVRDTGSNRFFGSGIGGFHVTINAGGKYKNLNLAPESKDKAEGKLIIDLLTAYTRRADRTK